MKRIVIGLALGASSIFLVGCGAAAEEETYSIPEPVEERPTISNSYVELQAVYGTVEKVTIDGVTCMVYDGSSAGGISCDWTQDTTGVTE